MNKDRFDKKKKEDLKKEENIKNNQSKNTINLNEDDEE